MVDEGFARNIRNLFGTDIYVGLDARPLKSVFLSDDKEVLTFTFDDGSKARFKAEGD